MSAALKSYAKSTAACLVLVAICAATAILSLAFLPQMGGLAIAGFAAIVTLAGVVLTAACAVVLWRYQRGIRGKRDLFLELNRSLEPAAIESDVPPKRTRFRRWLARWLLGHDFLVGDLVEIRPWPEIRATLDQQGCLEQLPFMPEMLAMCGRRAYVFRSTHRIFDYRKSRRMRHMHGAVLLSGAVCDGSSHGGCEAACHTIWKAAWLTRVVRDAEKVTAANTAILQFGTRAPRYVCQLTQLHAASVPVSEWNLINSLRPLIAGNVTPAAFVAGWLTYLFNELQHLRQGVGFPAFEPTQTAVGAAFEKPLSPGDEVIVRSPGEIRATLNDQFIHRGMGFEADMLKHCGRRYRVQAEIKRLIDIVTGEMRTMKTPAYVLRGVHFSGERQLFNAQYEPLFWRAAWLREASPRSKAAADVD